MPAVGRCRLCTSNDREALIEEIAAKLWERTSDRTIYDVWAKASPFWQHTMRAHAGVMLDILEQR